MAAADKILVGRIINPHGIDGCVSAERLSDNPLRFCAGAVFTLEDGRSLTLERDGSMHKGRLLLRFMGCPDRNAAELLRGQALYVDIQDAPPLPEGSYYHFQLLGLKVRQHGQELGIISDVLEYTANDVYVVQRVQGGELLLPALKSVVKHIDLEAGVMDVVLPEGLA